MASKLEALKEAGTYKTERVLTSPQGSVIRTQTHSKLINFCSNNYLGFANNREILEAVKKTFQEKGFSNGSYRPLTGTSELHQEMERKISQFYEQDECISFSSCFSANENVFEVLLHKNDFVLTDKLNHASIINGVRLSEAKRLIYENNDTKDLESQLQKVPSQSRKLIVTDGVFSMDGTIGRIDEICSIAKKYNALVFVDECHGMGVLGEKGRGAVEFKNSLREVDLISSTMGKALGGACGGFITGKRGLIEELRNSAPAYLHSQAISSFIASATIKALDLMQNNPEIIEKLRRNIKYFREAMTQSGFEVMGDKQTAICPVLLRDEKKTVMLANSLLEEGIYVIGFTYPVVGKGLARIRNQISADHSEKDIERCVEAYKKQGKRFGLI